MILSAVLLIAFVILTILITLGLGVGVFGLLLVFGDIIVFGLIVWCIIKHFIKRK